MLPYHCVCVTFGVHGNHSPDLKVCSGHEGWPGAVSVPCRGTPCRRLHPGICPSSVSSTRTGRCNTPCSHSPQFYLRVSFIHSSAWRWMEIGGASQGPPPPASNTFLPPPTGLLASPGPWWDFIKACAYFILILTRFCNRKRINFFVFCHCAVSSLLSKVMKAEALADWMSKGHWVQGKNIKQKHTKSHRGEHLKTFS